MDGVTDRASLLCAVRTNNASYTAVSPVTTTRAHPEQGFLVPLLLSWM